MLVYYFLRSEGVQKYEIVHVTPILNPFPRGKDLLSLRSNNYNRMSCSMSISHLLDPRACRNMK